MRRVLEAQQIQDRLARRLGEGVRVGNKTGNFADVIHDSGIIAWSGWTIVVVVLTRVRPPWPAISKLGRAHISGSATARG